MLKEIKVKYETNGLRIITMPRDGDVGIDLYAAEDVFIPVNKAALINTGVSFQLPEGYWTQLVDRSSVSKYGHVMAGIIDETYRGLVKVRFYCHTVKDRRWFNSGFQVTRGLKITQAIIRKNYNRDFKIVTVDSLDTTSRGSGGFGSTGK